MPDTSRTLAQIKALFADNATGQISPQDLRDFVESVADPVVDGIGDPVFNRGFYLARSGITITLPAASGPNAIGTVVNLPLDINGTSVALYSADPGGWADNTYSLAASDLDNTWGQEWTAHQALLLPRGLYDVYIFLNLLGADIPVPTGSNADWPVGVFLDQIEYDHTLTDSADVPTSPWMYDHYFNVLGYSISAPRNLGNGLIEAVAANEGLVNDNEDPEPFGLMAYTYGYEDDVDIVGYSVQIREGTVMQDEQLEQLLELKGPSYPSIAKALSELPDGHPLKPVPSDVEVSIPIADAVAEANTRLDELEARVAALEARASD